MRIKIISFLLIFFLLFFSTTVSLIAHECVPACEGCETCEAGVCVDDDDNCDDCYSCVDASCDWDCDTCYKCESASCVPCKCWDDGGPITGSITAQDALLCEVVIHTSSISDTDHWILGGNGEGEPTDTISSYSWDQAAGTNPMLGTFNPPKDEATVEWEAPPCKGTVIIRLDADDAPDSMDNPCPGSERDDPNKVFQDTVTVSLPTGCDDCVGDPEITLHINPVMTTDPSSCSRGGCGYADYPSNLDIFILTPCYDGCTWRFGVIAIADVLFGPCLERGNYTPIDSGNDPDLTEENYCEIVDDFDYDPFDESTGTGCACIGGEGEDCDGGTQYSNTLCLWVHEAAHVDLFKDALDKEEEDLSDHPAFDDMLIDCSDPFSKTCLDAKDAREVAITTAVEDAFLYCYICHEELARLEAYECFKEIADAICLHAEIQGWADCDACE